MSRAVCLRCDWQGSAEAGGPCPRCGAPLFGADPKARGPRGGEAVRRPDAEPAERLEPAPAEPIEPPVPDGERPASPWLALAGLAAALLVIALVWTRLPDRGSAGDEAQRESPLPPSAGQGTGSLVYAARVGPGSGRGVIWRVDLATGASSEGPEIPRALDLVDASADGAGWVGLTASSGRDGEEAFLLHGTSPAVGPVSLARGRLIAWGPGATSLAVLGRPASSPSCRSPSRIDVLNVLNGTRDHLLQLCSPIDAIGRTSTATFFSATDGDRQDLYFSGVVGVAHPILRGYRLLSVSPASDFLVVPGSRHTARMGTVLYWQGHGGPIPLGTADADLIVDRVLAWSADGSQVAVVGRLQARRGVFLVDAGAGTGRREPTFVVPGGREVDGTFSDTGVLYLVIDGHPFSYADGRLADVLFPAGSPAPTGPIVWIP